MGRTSTGLHSSEFRRIRRDLIEMLKIHTKIVRLDVERMLPRAGVSRMRSNNVRLQDKRFNADVRRNSSLHK